jgi:NAD(P)-dependent dehydrogenase (short-subunit alcohol dehydrogenase family)
MSVALITGASRGLGEALARGLADAGWRLVIDARGAADLNRVAAELSASPEVVAIPGDIIDSSHRADLIDAARRLGGPDLIVNTPGRSDRAHSPGSRTSRWTSCCTSSRST